MLTIWQRTHPMDPPMRTRYAPDLIPGNSRPSGGAEVSNPSGSVAHGSLSVKLGNMATFEALLRGNLTITDIARHGCVCTVSLSPGRRPALTPRERTVIEWLVRGSSQKLIAYELRLATTTVSAHIRSGLTKLGLTRWEQAVLAGAILARAKMTADDRPTCGHVDGRASLYFEAELCNVALALLTPSEREVALRVVDGGTNREIGSARCVTQRTVANQIAAAYRKLHAHGRLDLIRRLTAPAAVGE